MNAGSPPVSYSVPAGYSLNLSTPQEVDLTSASGAEELSFAVDPAAENLEQAIRTMTLGGETGYVIEDATQPSGAYVQAVVVRHAGVQYEALCKGYAGYDPSLLSSGCHSFLASISFTS